jgi:hypothetical protein
MESSPPHPCPLCGASASPYFRDDWRDYLQCPDCSLVHVPRELHLDPVAERAHYGTHDNRLDDPAYRAFLARLAGPVLERVQPPAAGLDFGCGPGPALAAMLEEAGIAMALYDPYFAPDTTALQSRYDLITASEVVEHLARPGAELDRLWSMLNPGGWLGIMTRRLPPREGFARWHYRRDPTHVCFFAAETFDHLARRWACRLELPAEDVALFGKPAAAGPPLTPASP